MKLIALVLLSLPLSARAEDSTTDKIKKDYVDPIFDNVGKAAKNAADPNAVASPALWAPSTEGMSPAAKKAVDYTRAKLIDPIGDELGDKAGRAAAMLGSADTSADSSALEDSIFNFPTKMAARITDVMRDMFSPHRTLILQPVAPLPGQEQIQKKLAPVATPKDFAYRKDSLSLVKGSGAASMSPRLRTKSRLKPMSLDR